DLLQVLARAKEAGVVKMMVTGGSLSDSRAALELAKQHEGLYSTVGCHPTRCSEFENCEETSNDPEQYYKALLELIRSDLESTDPENSKDSSAGLGGRNRTVVAVGECGLDYDRLEFCPKETQLSMKTEENLEVIRKIPVERLMVETDAPWCDIRPTHASNAHLQKQQQQGPQVKTWDSKKKEKFEMGKMVKSRNEPCTIG
ncbi:TatD DNase, partial [Quaeritorhiza haematococci]